MNNKLHDYRDDLSKKLRETRNKKTIKWIQKSGKEQAIQILKEESKKEIYQNGDKEQKKGRIENKQYQEKLIRATLRAERLAGIGIEVKEQFHKHLYLRDVGDTQFEDYFTRNKELYDEKQKKEEQAKLITEQKKEEEKKLKIEKEERIKLYEEEVPEIKKQPFFDILKDTSEEYLNAGVFFQLPEQLSFEKKYGDKFVMQYNRNSNSRFLGYKDTLMLFENVRNIRLEKNNYCYGVSQKNRTDYQKDNFTYLIKSYPNVGVIGMNTISNKLGIGINHTDDKNELKEKNKKLQNHLIEFGENRYNHIAEMNIGYNQRKKLQY